MAERNRPHILIEGGAAPEAYRPPPRKIEGKALPPPGDRVGHAGGLRSGIESASDEGIDRRSEESIRVSGSLQGVYVVFDSFPGIELAFESLDPRQGKIHPELRSVREVTLDGERVEQATVFIPDGKLGYFVGRIQRYRSTATADKPRSRDLIDRIQSIGLASLERMWTDPPAHLP